MFVVWGVLVRKEWKLKIRLHVFDARTYVHFAMPRQDGLRKMPCPNTTGFDSQEKEKKKIVMSLQCRVPLLTHYNMALYQGRAQDFSGRFISF